MWDWAITYNLVLVSRKDPTAAVVRPMSTEGRKLGLGRTQPDQYGSFIGSLISALSLRVVHYVEQIGSIALEIWRRRSLLPARLGLLPCSRLRKLPLQKESFSPVQTRVFLSKSKTVSGEIMGGVDQSFPVSCKQLSVDIKGNNTEVVLCSYDDHFLVIVTQIGTMGTILHARKEEGISVLPTFNVSVVFGKRDEPMLTACARQLIEHISNSGSSRPLVLSLGLKDHSMETLRGVVSAVIENRLW